MDDLNESVKNESLQRCLLECLLNDCALLRVQAFELAGAVWVTDE